jgi:hypothetical protein
MIEHPLIASAPKKEKWATPLGKVVAAIVVGFIAITVAAGVFNPYFIAHTIAKLTPEEKLRIEEWMAYRKASGKIYGSHRALRAFSADLARQILRDRKFNKPLPSNEEIDKEYEIVCKIFGYKKG